ncbi:Golgi transport complex subunit COG3 [Aspergillus homomorphus CBS 101889]|uniref:Conserved oligomeric Golgi complex subunit 3 n=1 Tax=Aspergillus homomorphus (strain CBS 101889) TaxID=1450537 RepID=A0A395I8T8_ASPHC|nr:Sec34-domain-containing protein [Aspergillus homomorphus CBS 101889]RAL15468.1 Sec34-domain-containing protein [Aspergillus homomorphus CBS 101889]
MRQQAAGQRSRRQTAPSGPPVDLKAKVINEQETIPDGLESFTDIKNELEFAQWYDDVEDSLLSASYDEYQACLQELQMSKSHLDSLLSDTSSTLDLLTSLSNDFKAVESQTSNFQKQCEGLLFAQTRDLQLATDIQDNLQYYDFLDPASRRLNAPGAGNTVRGQEFSDMLRRLDECLDYMEVHTDQKEADVYRSRYRLLMTRALTLIRTHFITSLRDIYADASKKIADKQLNETTMSTLLYAKFRVGAPELKQIGLEIQKRAVPPLDPDQGTEAEYQSLLNELHANYAATRGKLMIPLVRKNLNDIAQSPTSSQDLVSFARASISYIRGVCLDEFELWGEWFHGQGGLYDFLETICEPLYDHLRPRIIHEDKIVKLCQLCTLLQTRYLIDQDEELEQPVDANQLDFTTLIQPALEDVQTRLVFRAQAFLRDEIERYKPRPEDLDYPARNRQFSISVTEGQISGRKVASEPLAKIPKPTKQAEEGTEADADAKWDLETPNASSGWYPTLRKAIWLLSRIYRLVNSTVFDDLAHQIVHQTTLSLHHASTLIPASSTTTTTTPTNPKSPTTTTPTPTPTPTRPETHRQLFLMSHLLILKQQIVAFDIEYVAPETSLDFSGLTHTFWELREERGGLFNPRNLVRLVGQGLLPRVVENMLDAKVELDGRLRTVINDFIHGYATSMTASLPAKFVANPTTTTAAAAAAATAAVEEWIYPTCRKIESEVLGLRRVLGEYLDDLRMRETLVGAVQERVIQIYEEFWERFVAEERRAGSGVRGTKGKGKGKGREDDVWDVDTFVEWCEGVFRVGVAGVVDDECDGGGDDDGMSSRTGSLGSLRNH